jgi:hypothetical protein
VVVHIINVECITVGETENDPPVCSNRYRPKTFVLAFERMQTKTGHIHVGHSVGRVESRENITYLNNVFDNNAARVVVLVKAFQSFVAYRPYQPAP